MKSVLIVNDEGYRMWTILVDGDDIEYISNIIKNLHDEFYDNEGLQDKYGGYYDYVTEALDKINGIELLEINILEL